MRMVLAWVGLLLVTGFAVAQEPPREPPPPPPAVAPAPEPPPVAQSVAPPMQRASPAQTAALPPLPLDAPRMALVIGESAYQGGALATAVNDAGLVAEALRGAGFDVTAGADLDEQRLRDMVRDFIDRLEQAPPDSAVVVYLAGRAVQFEGENIFLPVGARLEREGDALLHGLRMSDLARALAETPPVVKMLLIDASGTMPPSRNGRNPAPGLAIMDPPENVEIGFSTAPDAIAPEPQPPYGPYAKALAEMMRLPGLGVADFLAKTRLRVHEDTKGQQTPWNAGNLRARDFNFFVPDPNAQTPPTPQPVVRLQKGLADFPPAEAYAIVVERDRIADYQEFLRIYPDDPLARRVKYLLAQRREALLWRKAVTRNTPDSYWTYMRTYPQGSFVVDARSRLARLQAQPVPPENFAPLVYEDVPPPLVGVEIVEPAYTFGGWVNLPPPPPPPVYILPPPPQEFVILAPPPPPIAPYILPVPVFVNRPYWARPPRPRPPPPPVTRPERPSLPAPGFAPAGVRPVQPAPGVVNPSPTTAPQPMSRQEFRQQFQQRQQQLQAQQGRPLTREQKQQLRQQLRQEQLRGTQTQSPPNARLAPSQRMPPKPEAAPTGPGTRRMELMQQRQQQREQRLQEQRQQQNLQQQKLQQRDQRQERQQMQQQRIQQQKLQQRQELLQQRQQDRTERLQERAQQRQERAQQQRPPQAQIRQQQMMEQRQERLQQRLQQREQRQQQMLQQRQQHQQQMMQQRQPHAEPRANPAARGRGPCGHPGQPPCR